MCGLHRLAILLSRCWCISIGHRLNLLYMYRLMGGGGGGGTGVEARQGTYKHCKGRVLEYVFANLYLNM